tara:strand:+ start:54 stop:287 length:234 start_codon:yes stop_codon:yes gene_type:complete
MNNRYEAAPIPEWGTLRQKQRNQVKSKFYYIFWGLATVSVFAGQMYVGSGYRQMSQSLNRIFDTIEVEVRRDFGGLY